jgi:glycosidase
MQDFSAETCTQFQFMPSPSLLARAACAVLFSFFLLVAGLQAQNFTETGGMLRLQAEQATSNTPRTINGVAYSWATATSVAGYTGTGFMEVGPNDQTSVTGAWTTTSPELGYAVTFANPGTYFVWIRAFAETAENASVYIGLNGASPAQASLGVSQFNAWKWTNTAAGSDTPVAISVPMAGTYTLNVWMNDAGFRFDRIILTRNPNYTPDFSADFWRHQNIYQIITDRFFDGNPANNNFYGWADPNIGNKTHGGDFLGIEKKLDYIKALGATAIWISPVVKNGAGDFDYHGYAGTDFYNTDPRFGSMSDLQRLVAEAHKRGILVVNDVVVNHASTWVHSTDTGWPTFKYPPSGYNLSYTSSGRFAAPFDNASLQTAFGNTNLSNAFNNNGATQNWSDMTQVELGELVSLDDFKTQSTYVRDKMAEIYSHWINTAGFDAYRIDTVKHVEMGFWDNWSPRIRAAAAAADKPNFFQFGEVYDGSDAKCGSYTGTKTTAPFKMESVVDYPLFYQVGSVFATATGATKQIEDRYNNLNTWNYDQSALNSLVTFLDNHDQNRFLNAGGGTARLQVALAFLYTSRGVPCLYYGTEQDFDGGADP